MLDGITDYSDKADTLINTYIENLGDKPIPPRIFHYTNDQGLKGIFESGKFWLTNLFSLNDPSELNHGIRLALDILQSKTNNGPEEAKLFCKNFKQLLYENAESIAHNFVCCFSKDSDDLGQWRANGDDGQGFAIGFDTKGLEKAFSEGDKEGEYARATFPVSYDDQKLCEIHISLVNNALPVISAPQGRGLSEEELEQFMWSLEERMANSFYLASILFKHEA